MAERCGSNQRRGVSPRAEAHNATMAGAVKAAVAGSAALRYPWAMHTVSHPALARLAAAQAELAAQGLLKTERTLVSPQNAQVQVVDEGRLLNLCANNYLGLADHPAIIQAAHDGLDQYGFGMASVRFICGTHAVHRGARGAAVALPRHR